MWRYLIAAVLLILEGAAVAWALLPDVDPLYRAFYMDRSTDCYPLPVSGDYRLGTEVSLVRGTDDARQGPLLRCGWRVPGPNGTWSDGRESMLRFRVGEPQPLRLTLGMRPYLYGTLLTQGIVIFANDTRVAEFVIDRQSEGIFVVDIPEATSASGEGYLDVRFQFDDARSPRELGHGNDRHAYAVRLISVRLEPVPPESSSAAPG